MTEEIIGAAGAGAGAILAVVAFSAELLTAVAGEAGQTFALPVHRVTFPSVEAVTVVTAVRPELARPAGRVAEFSGPAPGTGAGPGEGVTVSSLAGTVLATLRPVVTWRTGIQAVITRGAGPTVTAPRGRVTGLRGVTGGTELLTVEPEGPRGAGLLTLGSGVAGLAPTLPGGGMTGGGRQSTLTVQTAVLTPPSFTTDGVAGLSPPAVFTLTPPSDVVTALAVLLHTVALVLAVQAVAPSPAL